MINKIKLGKKGDRKMIYLADLIIVGISLAFVAGLIGYAKPMIIAPSDGLVTENASVLFVFEKAQFIYIDDNAQFSSPEKISVTDNLVINLQPGKYYWKIEGVTQSEIRELTINSNVDLRLRKSDEGYEVVNSGNSRLKVDIYNKGTLVGNIILDVDKNASVRGTAFVGGQDG